MGSLASAHTSAASLGAIGRRKLRALATALGVSEEVSRQALDVFTLMSGVWGDWAVGDSPRWPNDISDDGTPFEFSASFDGGVPRLRLLVEAQSECISRTSSWEAGIALGERLKAEHDADLTLFDRVRDLFAPRAGAQGRFFLWHAAVLEEGRPALFKAYMNPCSFGVESAPYVLEQALNRLGFRDAWRFLKDRLASDVHASVRYFSVDLEASEQARVKVYLGCSRSAEAVDQLIEPAGNSRPNDARRWLDTLTGSQGPFESRPILSCFSFRRELAAPDVTVHVPIRCYVKHDAEALARVAKVLTKPDAARLSRALSAMSERPLDVGRGLLTYASLRREASNVRVTVYLAPEAYSITSRRPSVPPASGYASGVHKSSPLSAPARSAHMGEVLRVLERQGESLAAQPLLRHLGEAGSADQAARVCGHVALLALWLGDLFRFAQERSSDALISARLADLGRAQAVRTQQFNDGLQGLGVLDATPPLFSAEYALIRALAFSKVTAVIAADHDCVRLAIALVVSATSKRLLSAGFAFAAHAVTGRAPESTPGADDCSAHSELSLIEIPDSVVAAVYSALDCCFESLVQVMDELDRSTFSSTQ